ncbi:MAG TPA: hypothetical protein VI485_22435 [Vicinamibacterales bacterium]|nr:hypothetical protein [Vicinamibacterales bacterium]
MAGEDITVVGDGDLEERIRSELAQPLGAERQRKFRRFFLAALGSVPWVGGFLSAAASLDAEREQQTVNELQQEWLEEHRAKLAELGKTLLEIIGRLETLGTEVEQRIQSPEYLGLVRQAFRVWDQSDTSEKRRLIQNLLTNAGGTPLTADDVVRLFIQWIDYYHEAHFAVIRCVFQNPACTRAEIWSHVHGNEVRENSAEADLFKLLIRDLSTGGVIRQHRDTTEDGSFVKRTPVRRPKGYGSQVMKSAFDDVEQYELTELGNQFVHYTMNEVVPRLGA